MAVDYPKTKTKNKTNKKYMPKVTSAEVVKTGNFLLPRTRVNLRVLSAESKKSSKDNDMIVLKTEVASGPDGGEIVNVGGVKCQGAGTELTYYLPLTEKTFAQFFDLCGRLGLQVTELDTENLQPVADMFKSVGLISAIVSTQPDKKQTKGEDGKYHDILDEDGKPVEVGFKWNNQVQDIVGLSKVKDANRPY